MENSWQPKPGDKIVRHPRIRHLRLRRVVGVMGLFSAGYGNVGSSIYYALGIVALVALGATPIALAIAGILFIFTALTYAEGTAMIPEAGGSASFARHAFNDLVGFISGWALMLSYIVTISISAYTIPPYLGHFWEPLRSSPIVGTLVSMGLIGVLMVINVIGVRESSRVNILAAAIDLATQLSIIILGILFILLGFDGMINLIHNMFNNWPETTDLVFGIALATIAYTGVETVSQLAEETKEPQSRAPRALMMMIAVVLIMFAGISVVALSAMTPQELGNIWGRDPVAGIVTCPLLPEIVQTIFGPLVAVLAATILFIATNAGIMGISRLSFSLSSHHQLPSALGRVHYNFRTPYFSIILFCLIAIALLVPGFFSASFFSDLGALYTFGALLSFAFAHASILMLRVKNPGLPRPFKLKLNIKIKGREIPLTAVVGLVATFGIWVIIVINQQYAPWIGFGWMLLGLLIYYGYRQGKHLPLT